MSKSFEKMALGKHFDIDVMCFGREQLNVNLEVVLYTTFQKVSFRGLHCWGIVNTAIFNEVFFIKPTFYSI
jgi:hypothetical protein